VKAVRWHARGDVRVDDVPLPEPGPHQARLRVTAAGICGTDVDEVRHGPINVPVSRHPRSGRMAPITLGHEIAGVVDAVGDGSDLALGALVAPWPLQPCGHCASCVAGFAHRCEQMVSLGMSADGGLAEYVIVDERHCVSINPALPQGLAAAVEPYAVALHGLHQVDVTGRKVVVVGMGSIGRCVAEGAYLAGAHAVTVVTRADPDWVTRDFLGRVRVVSPADAPALQSSIVFEASGLEGSLATALAAAQRGGVIVVLGSHTTIGIDFQDVLVRELIIRGAVSHCYERDFIAAANALSSGELGWSERQFGHLTIDDVPDALLVDGEREKRILVPKG
jgi:(R,R)-butanediol dehydrogenase / meso-butanediol dehydrogenase / diacetyl reductase